MLVDEVQPDAGLHADQRDVVSQNVVELLGDLEPLLAGPPLGLLPPYPPGLLGPLPANLDELRHRGQHQQPGGQSEGLLPRRRPVPPQPVGQPEERHPAERQRPPGGPFRTPPGGIDVGHDEPEPDRAEPVADDDVGQRRDEGDFEDDDREASPHGQSGRPGQEQCDAEGVEGTAGGLGPMVHGQERQRQLDESDGQRHADVVSRLPVPPGTGTGRGGGLGDVHTTTLRPRRRRVIHPGRHARLPQLRYPVERHVPGGAPGGPAPAAGNPPPAAPVRRVEPSMARAEIVGLAVTRRMPSPTRRRRVLEVAAPIRTTVC